SCDWNRNWWHCMVISSICPGVISVALADIARERFSILLAVPLRLSKALTIILAVADSPGGAVLVTALASLGVGAVPPARSSACANSRTSTAAAWGCSAGEAAGLAAASIAATWIASIIWIAPEACARGRTACLYRHCARPRGLARSGPIASRLLLAGDRVQRFGHAVLRGGRVVGHELHLQAGRGQRNHLRGLVGAGADRVGQRGDFGRLRVERLPPGARHGFVPAGAAAATTAARAGRAAGAVGESRGADVLV